MPVHPFASVPVSVYVVLTVGETVMLVVVEPLFHQEYVLPPLAVSVALLPGQIEPVPPTVTVGVGFTVTIMVPVLVQGCASVTVTV